MTQRMDYNAVVTSYLWARLCRSRKSKMPRNPQESRSNARMENPEKIGGAVAGSVIPLDRRVSVAPMMDWSDDRSWH